MTVVAFPVRMARSLPVSSRALLLAVGALLLLEIVLFGWSFGQFFCGDSLFYLWHRVDTPAEALRVLTHQDHLKSYRPLTYIIFSWLLFPLFGLNPLGYHFVTLGAHLLISVLAFLLLRELAARPAAAIAGLFFFGVHAVNFYVTYDVSFLPDFGSGLFYVAGLLCYARHQREPRPAWLAAGLLCLVLALLCKESAITLVAGVWALDLIRRNPEPAALPPAERPRWLPSAAVLPFAAVAALYLAWTLYLKAGAIYPSGAREPYALTLDPAALKLKLRYLAWFANLPTQFARRGWPAYAAVVAMAPALVWIGIQVGAAGRRAGRSLAVCGVWALAALAPVLFIAQAPMKHNLYMPVLACAVALALILDARGENQERLLPGAWPVFAAGMAAATALQVPGDLKYSWVGEASHVARASLDAVKTAYPVLPRGALLYVLPTDVKGRASWYFEDGALFNLFYRDRSLRMRFADSGAVLPPDFAQRPEVLLFHFHAGRLWDVTRQYKRDALDGQSFRLLERVPRARIENAFRWEEKDLPSTRDVVAVRPVGRNGQSRLALIMVPGTTARFPLPAIPSDSVLQVGVTPAGPLRSGSRGRIVLEDPNARQVLLTATLDGQPDAQHWWDREVDLGALAGRAGTLVIETVADHDADWLAWSRLRIIQRNNPVFAETSAEIDRELPAPSFSLLDRFEAAEISFDRNEKYPDYSRFDTPEGQPVFLYAARQGQPGHFAMVTIAGASAKFPLERVPPGAVLEVAVMNLGRLGDGVRATVVVEDAEGPERIFNELLPPKGNQWADATLPLAKWAGRRVNLVFAASSGPRHETIADWCAWGRLRIVTK